ncbi:helix-turn-helix domain-containing protein [Tumebacillus sp. ITR2]|uniref:Helix-turn-helix domain-containing protein n=1 Tax=Tumebacillus amylolyticus TaxID=2801339 RepID=A0ABS1J788_9BACL|nr:helix-turn-helix domain-containing protein [Tumebacillus amylolyticus]MBL0386146.1 helix-turn-helix domain-containing protein [Tumebacillus amylolyticus]
MMEETLRSLILRAKRGDSDALAAIIERFRPLIKKYTRQADEKDAHDLEQELVMRLIVLVRSYREELPYGFMELVEREWAKNNRPPAK